MITISLCMIVKNEEDVLARCLDSIKSAVDEIIIVDTGSTDNTKSIALEYTDKVHDFEWTEDFSAARNMAFSKATMDFQMWLDADDVIPEEELKKLLKLKETLDPNYDIVVMKYITHFDENGAPIFSSTRERLLKRERGFTWADPIHEYITICGNIYHSDIVIHHRKLPKAGPTDRNLKIFNSLEASGKELTPRQLYYFARELKDHAFWAKAVYYFEKFLETGQGWVEDNIAACYNLAICYRILGDMNKILPILTKSFLYDAPRAEICTEIGYHYKRANDFKKSLKWFKLATNLGTPDSMGFILIDHWGYIPNIEACVCCYELGDYEGAKRFNEAAAKYKPESKSVELNRKVLAKF